MNKLWQQCQRKKEVLLLKHQNFLKSNIYMWDSLLDPQEPSPGPSRGRPLKSFDECSEKSKRRRVENLVNTYEYSELSFAATESAKMFGINETLTTWT